jgi:hypothetical protein
MMKAARVPVFVLFLATPTVPLLGQATTKIANSIGVCRSDLGTPGSGEYDVDITFSGISVFDRSVDGVIDVRIPNLVGGRAVINDTQGHPVRKKIPSHIAYILADVRTAKPLIDAHAPVQPAFNEASCYVYYRLTNEVVMVDPASAPSSTNKNVCVTDASDANFCPDGTTEGSMKWLPSLKQILGSAQVPDDPHFKNPDGTTLAGMVRVDRGYLETVVNPPKKLWAFLQNSGDTETKRQAIAQEVHWHMRGAGTKFVLKLQPPTGSPVNLEFEPVAGKVSLFISNSPIDETGPIHKSMSMNEDPHFRAYYEFIKSFDVKKGPLPFKSSKNCQNGSLVSNPVLKLCAGCPNPDPADCATQLAESGNMIASSDFKPKPPAKKSTAKTKYRKSRHGRMSGMAATRNPLPSGLNCGSTQWP